MVELIGPFTAARLNGALLELVEIGKREFWFFGKTVLLVRWSFFGLVGSYTLDH